MGENYIFNKLRYFIGEYIMAVSENALNEIFNERAQYLVNVDDLLLERFGEQVPGKKIGIPSESAQFWKTGCIDIAQKISDVDQLFESKEYQTYIQLTRPSKSKFHPEMKKISDDELQDFNSIKKE